MRQIGSTVVWFGEQNFTGSKPSFANVGVGRRSGDIITMEWADVAKCNLKGKGTLKLKVTGTNTISKIGGSGFGGSTWTRQVAPPSWDGLWVNTDSKTNSITKLNVSNNCTRLRAWGSCSPTDCDWGTVGMSKYGSGYRAIFNTSVAKRTIILTPQSNGRLKLSATYDYKDSRPTKRVVNYYKKK